jgi:glycosyltransferase involved in cell wall biosynthesis
MTIYYLCPDYSSHAGGVRVIYRHVDLLRRNGFEAYVVHERQGFRDPWFDNDTPILGWSRQHQAIHGSLAARTARYIRRGVSQLDSSPLHVRKPSSFEITGSDVVVIPETFGPKLSSIAPGVPKIIFSQGTYVAFAEYPADRPPVILPHRHPDVAAILVISDDSRRMIEYAFPGIKTYRVRWSLNPQYYSFEPRKIRQITYMPRKGVNEAKHVLATVQSRGAIDSYRVRTIENLDEAGVAACLRESRIFLSLGYQEGLPLPPAEAMACGAIVVGYDGFGGSEYLRPDLAFPVPAGDLLEFAKTLERVLTLFEESPRELLDRAERAAAYVAENYSPAREETELIQAWQEILADINSRPLQ